MRGSPGEGSLQKTYALVQRAAVAAKAAQEVEQANVVRRTSQGRFGLAPR